MRMSSYAGSLDPVRDAVDTFRKLYNVIHKCNLKKAESSLRSRSRSMPSMLSEAGLVPMLSFCYAKAEGGTYAKMYEALDRNPNQSLSDDEKLGYALYLYAVLKEIQSFGILDAVDAEKPREFIEKLVGAEPGKTMLIEKLLYPYLAQFKRLCEAVFESKTKGEESEEDVDV